MLSINLAMLLLAAMVMQPATQPTTRPAVVIVVAPDGGGDVKTLQEAIDRVPANNTVPHVIELPPGTYRGQMRLPKTKPMVTIRGGDAKTTVITNDFKASTPGAEGQPLGTSRSATFFVESNDCTFENLTFENSAGDVGQALALNVRGDRVRFFNCRMIGWQDTLMANRGRHYYRDCHIEGRVDFIFGAATAVFENCTIHSKNGGYVTAASTAPDQPFGFVFIRCKLTGEGAPAYLGRPWRPHASVTFINCEMGDHIRPEGWHNWGKVENERTARYAEYRSSGPGGDPKSRVPWSRQLTDDEASRITVQSVLSGDDGWDPTSPN
jgi:pectinesterase